MLTPTTSDPAPRANWRWQAAQPRRPTPRATRKALAAAPAPVAPGAPMPSLAPMLQGVTPAVREHHHPSRWCA
jgi:hypothetical protein